MTGAWGCPLASRTAATLCTPSGSETSSDPHISGDPFVEQGGRRTRIGLAPQKVADEVTRIHQQIKITALAVTPQNKARIEKERKENAIKLAKEKAVFEELGKKIDGMRFVVPRRVAEGDNLYGSVTSNDIADLLKAKGFEVEKRKVSLEEPIKKLGEHTVKVRLHPEVETTIRLLVTKEA